jgi:hypothetical protein
MDKTMAYDEPLDPHWERLNALGASLDEILAGVEQTSDNNRLRHHSIENVVPFQTRQVRALEMRANIDRAILDGHLEKFPDLDGVGILFTNFAAASERLGVTKEKWGGPDKREGVGGIPKVRDELLECFNIAWGALRALERDGFPLMDYVDSPALDGPEIVGTLVITKLPDGTIVSTKHEPLSNEPGVS